MDLAEVGRRGLHLHPLDHLSLALGSPPENPRLHTAQLENLSQDEVQRVTFAFKASTCLSDLTLRHQVNKSETQNIKNTDDSSVCPHPPNSAVTSKASLPLFLPHPLLPGLTPPTPRLTFPTRSAPSPYRTGGPGPGCAGTPLICLLRTPRSASLQTLRAPGRLGGAPASAVPASRGRCGAGEDLSSAAWSDGDLGPQPASQPGLAASGNTRVSRR